LVFFAAPVFWALVSAKTRANAQKIQKFLKTVSGKAG